ncbi:hypothetical protein CAF53_02290 [Sphingobium sp. LB126]|uniref:HAD family hydrolase n=1 Tax=Sphingobium sp. LB126 TaxID=1983755 RepID=UPI000C20FCD6|nr:HAD family hydrolase [Sphingobium sp. LB126]PJG47196.1 hypothetical protein CAF53_02290 [Sphingobium sp. LB126]
MLLIGVVSVLSPEEAAGFIVTAKAVLFDWDGCLAAGGSLLVGAGDILRALGSKSYILSNNSTDQPRDLTRLLKQFDVMFPLDNVLLAGHQTLACEAARSNGRPICLVAAPQMVAHAMNLGLNLVMGNEEIDEAVETVIIMRDTSFNFRTLTTVVNSVRDCKRIVVSNPDMTHPGLGGTVQPETGALFEAIRACLGDRTPVIEIIGKPSQAMFVAALDRAGVRPAQAVMVGDNPATDGAGAEASGIPFVQVHPEGPLTMALLAQAVCERLASETPRSINQ